MDSQAILVTLAKLTARADIWEQVTMGWSRVMAKVFTEAILYRILHTLSSIQNRLKAAEDAAAAADKKKQPETPPVVFLHGYL